MRSQSIKSVRGKVIGFVLFCMLFIWRWTSMESLLPETWTADSRVRYTARLLEEVEHTDSETIIRDGIWTIKLRGYHSLLVGEQYSYTGRVEREVLLTKVRKMTLVDPTFEMIEGSDPLPLERVVMGLSRWREGMVDSLSSWLPEPHSSLSAGILLGVRRRMPYTFYQELVSTGTLHIIAASGYNVMIVARVVMGVLLVLFSRGVAIVGGVLAIFSYVVIAGGSAAVVRAGIMGSLTLVAYYWGRSAEAKRLLWVTSGLMLLAQPKMLLDVGFQLSVSATAGLLYLEPWIRGRFERKKARYEGIRGYLREYWWPTVAATLATMPVIYLTFGRVSYLSPIVNMLVLPLTPLIMFLSALAVGVGGLIPALGQVVSWALYVPLEIMIVIIRIFG